MNVPIQFGAIVAALLVGLSFGQRAGSTPNLPQAERPAPLNKLINYFEENGPNHVTEVSRERRSKALRPVGLLESDSAVLIPDKSGARKKAGLPSHDKIAGTAFLISPCYILTNYHTVFGSGSVNRKLTSTFSVPDDTGNAYYKMSARPIVEGTFDDDWALMALDKCAGERVGWMEIAKRTGDPEALQGLKAKSSGFPGSRSATSLWEAHGTIVHYRYADRKGRPAIILTTVGLEAGASGSPVYLNPELPEVIAIQMGPVTPLDGIVVKGRDELKLNKAIDMYPIFGKIKDRIENNINNTPNPARR